jgi:membrane protease YdiL (CAAX protease family)
MTSKTIYPALSLLGVALVLAYYAWITVVPFGYPGAPVVALVMLGLLVTTLKLGVREPQTWWEAADSSQAPRVLGVILLGIVIQLAIGWGLRTMGSFDGAASTVVFLGVWTGLPVLMLALGVIRWPRRVAAPSMRALLAVAIPALLVAAGIGLLGWTAFDSRPVPPPILDLLVGGAATLLGATVEEVVFRVLLLTALVRASGSPTQALVLSSVVFALYHVPSSISVPLLAGDWGQVGVYAQDYLPDLVWTTGLGFLFGALWLRTGSLTLISICHALCNMGQVLVGETFGYT